MYLWHSVTIAFILVVVPILWAIGSLFNSWIFLQAVYFIMPVAMLVYIVQFIVRRRNERLRLGYSIIAFAAFEIAIAATTLLAQVDTDWAYPLFKWVTMFAVWNSVFFIGALLTPDDSEILLIEKLLDVLSIIIVSSVCMTLVFPSFGEVQAGEAGTRYFGPFGDSVGFILAFFCLRALAAKKWGSLAVCAFALLLTGTRGALLVVSAGLLLFTLLPLTRRALEIRKAVVVGVALMLIVLFAGWESEYAGYAIDRMFDAQQLAASNRFGSTQLGFNVFADNPFFGVGYLGFKERAWEYNPEAVFFMGFSEHFVANTSNQLLQTATDGGVIGVALFILFWVLWFRRGKTVVQSASSPEVARHLNVYFVSVCALLIGNQTAVWLLPDSLSVFLYLFLAGILVGYRGPHTFRASTQMSRRVRVR